MQDSDILHLVCKDCGKEQTLTRGELGGKNIWYSFWDGTNTTRRCNDCQIAAAEAYYRKQQTRINQQRGETWGT